MQMGLANQSVTCYSSSAFTSRGTQPGLCHGAKHASIPVLRHTGSAAQGQQRSRRSLQVHARDLNAVERGIRGYQYNASGAVKKAAEGKYTDNGSGGGNGTAYGLLAATSLAVAVTLAVAPHTVADVFFGSDAHPHDYLHEVLFRLVSVSWIGAAAQNLVNKAAAENNLLDDVVHRRANASLSFFAANTVFVTLLTFIPNPIYPHPIINVPAAVGLEALALGQWWVAGRNYAKYSEGIGANPVKIIKSYLRDFSTLGQNSGLNSTIYAALTAAFVFTGFAYQFAPVNTMNAIFGMTAEKGLEDTYLWQLIGGSIATCIAPIAYTQRDAANENNFSLPNKRTLMAGLAILSAAHVAVFLPLLNTDQSGPLLFPVGFVWGVSAVASTLIAVKPKE
ncbi:hypothetical protein ABBQ32_001857 [Trebouxia sp. C0010 RCD-2024]